MPHSREKALPSVEATDLAWRSLEGALCGNIRSRTRKPMWVPSPNFFSGPEIPKSGRSKRLEQEHGKNMGRAASWCPHVRGDLSFFFNLSIVYLQYHVSFRCTAKWRRDIYILFQILFPYRLLQNIEYSSLCYSRSLWLSILYTVVCMC